MSLLPRHASKISITLRNYTKIRCICGVHSVLAHGVLLAAYSEPSADAVLVEFLQAYI
jgi:hypothetical protein